MQFSPVSRHFISLWTKYSPQHPVLLKGHKVFNEGYFLTASGHFWTSERQTHNEGLLAHVTGKLNSFGC
jgi:hypothetical protein